MLPLWKPCTCIIIINSINSIAVVENVDEIHVIYMYTLPGKYYILLWFCLSFLTANLAMLNFTLSCSCYFVKFWSLMAVVKIVVILVLGFFLYRKQITPNIF